MLETYDCRWTFVGSEEIEESTKKMAKKKRQIRVNSISFFQSILNILFL